MRASARADTFSGVAASASRAVQKTAASRPPASQVRIMEIMGATAACRNLRRSASRRGISPAIRPRLPKTVSASRVRVPGRKNLLPGGRLNHVSRNSDRALCSSAVFMRKHQPSSKRTMQATAAIGSKGFRNQRAGLEARRFTASSPLSSPDVRTARTASIRKRQVRVGVTAIPTPVSTK
ncbi:MAG: hypothetical protein H6Q05_4184 [Acidobacteria bacterium]|nr:hypothetical protein [Acidobacteriota bacterium]